MIMQRVLRSPLLCSAANHWGLSGAHGRAQDQGGSSRTPVSPWGGRGSRGGSPWRGGWWMGRERICPGPQNQRKVQIFCVTRPLRPENYSWLHFFPQILLEAGNQRIKQPLKFSTIFTMLCLELDKEKIFFNEMSVTEVYFFQLCLSILYFMYALKCPHCTLWGLFYF